MSISYYLTKSTTGNKQTYYPVTQVKRTATTPELASHIAASTGLDLAVVMRVIDALPAQISKALLDGASVELGQLGIFIPKIVDASVASSDDPLPTTARLRTSFSLSKAVDDSMGEAQFHRITPPSHAPEWGAVVYQNGDIEDVSASTIVKMQGYNFDYTASRADEGVFVRLASAPSSSATKATVVNATPQKLWWMRPPAIALNEDIIMELRTRGRNAGASATLDTFTYPSSFVTS